jgi:hypothetical protein
VGADHSARPTISSFPPPPHVDLSTISEASSKRNSRPRPRPIFGRTGADPSINSSVSDPVFPHTPHKDQQTAVTHSDPAVVNGEKGISGPELNNFSPDIAERAKMRTRKATKQSPEYTDDVIDITDDDDFATTPVRKPKERRTLRPDKSAIPLENTPQLPSDPVTIPIPSSSPLLPPSDPFPASTKINSTPPRPYLLDAVAAPDSSPQQSPVQRRKRKRTGHPQSLIEDRPDPSRPTTARDGVTSRRLDQPPPSDGNLDATGGGDPGRNLKSDTKNDEEVYGMKTTPKKRKSSKKGDGSANSRSGSSRADKSRKKRILEVVITSPRKKKMKGNWKDGRNPEGTSSESKHDHPASSPTPAELAREPIEDDAPVSPRTSDGEDELILAPKRRLSSRPKLGKGKQKVREPRSVDEDATPGIEPSNERVAIDDEEGELSGKDEHHAEGASMSRTNKDHKSKSRPVEPETPAQFQVGSVAVSAFSLLTLSQENVKAVVSVQEDDRPKLGNTRETPAPGKSRYTLSRFGPKTPMRELIRRAASHPSAPFSASSSPIASPLVKTSKSALRRIAPLHSTRRTPPPPPPRPPPPKKSKKMLDLEDKWEMELEDEVEGWWALTDEERQGWRRAKRDKELGYDD